MPINKNEIINHNNYGRLRGLVVLFKIRLATRKDFFFLIYRQSGRKGPPALT